MANRTLTAGDRVAEFVLVERLGEGALGEVWKALPDGTGRIPVELEIAVDPQRFAALQAIGTGALGLEHPAVVRTLSIHATHEPPFVVMQHVSGPSLRQVLSSGCRLGAEPAARALSVVLDALAHAHERGVIHGNLRPENVVFEIGKPWQPGTPPDASRVRVREFGPGMVARSASDAGALPYLAPETRQGELADVQSDLYAAGVLLFEALSGRTPVGEESASEAAEGVPVLLDGVVAKALRAQPERRYATARAMHRDLVSCLAASHAGEAEPAAAPGACGGRSAADEIKDRVKRVVEAGKGKQTVDLSKAFNDAFEALSSNTVPLLVAGLLWGLLSFSTALILAGPLTAGLSLMLVRVIRDRQKVEVGDLFASFDRFWSKSLGFYALAIAAAIGFAHMILPGLLVMTLGMYVYFLMADRKWGFLEAVQGSVNLVWSHGLWMHAVLTTMTLLMGVSAGAIPGRFLTAWLLAPFFVGLTASAYVQVTTAAAATPSAGGGGPAPVRAAA